MDYSFFAPPAAPTHQPYQFFSLPDAKQPQTYTPPAEVQQDPLEAFNNPSAFQQFFDQGQNFDPPSFIPPQTSDSPAQSLQRQHSFSNGNYERPASVHNEIAGDADFANGNLERSSDDDKESLTPAQSRRKAQNRAAQRAFRERKEKHVKELEVKLKSIEAQSTDLLSDNERLRRELDRLTTQNEILRQTSGSNKQHGQSSVSDTDSAPSESLAAGPMVYSPKRFNAAFADHMKPEERENMSHRIVISQITGERLLAPGAAWDVIHSHEYVRRGMVDISQVVDKLKDNIVCNGMGPSFPEDVLIKAIEESVDNASDELI